MLGTGAASRPAGSDRARAGAGAAGALQPLRRCGGGNAVGQPRAPGAGGPDRLLCQLGRPAHRPVRCAAPLAPAACDRAHACHAARGLPARRSPRPPSAPRRASRHGRAPADLRAPAAGSPTLATVVSRVKAVVQDAVANADIPFPQVVEAANVPRSSAYTPVFQTLLTLETALGAGGGGRQAAGADGRPGGGGAIGAPLEFTSLQLLAADRMCPSAGDMVALSPHTSTGGALTAWRPGPRWEAARRRWTSRSS